MQSPLNYLQDRRLLVDLYDKQLHSAMKNTISQYQQQLVCLAAGLDAMSPLKVLSRGYSMVRDTEDHVISDANAVSVGDTIHIMLHSGTLDASIAAIHGGKNGSEVDL